jgi:hypothetical protein
MIRASVYLVRWKRWTVVEVGCAHTLGRSSGVCAVQRRVFQGVALVSVHSTLWPSIDVSSVYRTVSLARALVCVSAAKRKTGAIPVQRLGMLAVAVACVASTVYAPAASASGTSSCCASTRSTNTTVRIAIVHATAVH